MIGKGNLPIILPIFASAAKLDAARLFVGRDWR
jgi:signal transduction protein with GAF and PtsI domain